MTGAGVFEDVNKPLPLRNPRLFTDRLEDSMNLLTAQRAALLRHKQRLGREGADWGGRRRIGQPSPPEQRCPTPTPPTSGRRGEEPRSASRIFELRLLWKKQRRGTVPQEPRHPYPTGQVAGH
jgi:hypothetical protein